MFRLETPNENADDHSAEEDVRQLDDQAFLKKCKPKLEELEKIRFAKQLIYEFRKKITYPALFVLVPLAGYLDYLLLWWQRGNDDSGAGLTIALLAGAYWWVTQPKREYRKEYKERILPEIAHLFGPFTYSNKDWINIGEMEKSKILPSHDKFKAEDYFKGEYKGVGIEFCEFHMTETRGSGKNRRTVTKFKGLAILLAMKSKKFYGHTILDKDKSGVSEWFKQRSTKMKRARMADPEFEKLYDAYTTDQVEARYLIDPLMIEDLKDLHDQYTGNTRHDRGQQDKSWIEKLSKISDFKRGISVKAGLTAAFYENKMLILISSSHNHFEPADLHIPATDPDSVLRMKEEIGDILSIVDRLNLYDPRAVHEAEQTTEKTAN